MCGDDEEGMRPSAVIVAGFRQAMGWRDEGEGR